MESCVSFKSSGKTLYGILGTPGNGKRPAGCIVFIHGWSGCRSGPHRIIVEAAWTMQERGYATLRFDLSGRGESEGRHEETGLDEMIEDTAAAVEFARGRLGGVPVGLWGICSGGNVAVGTATKLKDVENVAAWSILPFQTHRSTGEDARRTGGMMKEYARKAFRRQTWRKLVRGRVNFKMVLKVLFGHFVKKGGAERNLKDSRRDIMDEFAGFRGALLFVYGGADAEGRGGRTHYEQFCRENSINAEFDEVAGANHNFYSIEWKREAIEKSASWFERRMPAAGA